MFTCPSCNSLTSKLIGYTSPAKVGCSNCGIPASRFSSCNLGQTADSWVKHDGTRGRITSGKNWEIANRMISKDDGKTPINRVTGKPAQY